MKINKRWVLLIVPVLIIVLIFRCTKDNSSVAKENIEEFLNKKSELYDKKNEIVNILNTAPVLPLEPEEDESFISDIKWEENYNEIFKDVKVLLTEKAYEKLSRNRYFLDVDLIDASMEDKYDKSEIKEIEYEKISEGGEEIIYTVKYIENLYSKDELKLEIFHEDEFTLKNIDGKWLISRID